MPPQKPKPSTAAQRADEALNRVAPEGKSPARRTLAFLLEGSHDEPSPSVDPDQTQTSTEVAPDPDQTKAITLPVAPARDYNKRANSIDREALPAGAFPGSSKKLYDALYLRTRGAVRPMRTARATRKELMKWTGIRDVKTVNAHVKKLIKAGLIVRTKLIGEHEGSIYEVFLPEETSTKAVPDPNQTHTSDAPKTNQKTDSDQYQKPVRVGSGNPIDSKDTSSSSQTSFKTNTENDDDALADLVTKLKDMAREVTGKETTVAERIRWAEVADVLTVELKIAAARTNVSSAPAFLAEHLRRRLWKRERVKGEAVNGGMRKDEANDSSFSVEEAKSCPDCGGTGFYYPNGYEGGVAKCKHEKLSK